MCLKCYPGPCSRYRCLKEPPPVVFVCDRCGNPAYAGEYDHLFGVISVDEHVCGSCLYVDED